VLAVCARLMLTVRENLTMLIGSRNLALTDSLTGLGNRRRLMEDLRLACRQARPEEPWRLAMYDLNGFKRFNDTYGHPAGDELLARLSDKLSASVAAHGTAYRMGGDEFCVLFKCSAAAEVEISRASVAALCEEGPGFAIGAAHGEVGIPTEAREPTDVLRLADQRLYRRKDKTREEYVARQSHTDARTGGRFDPAVVTAFAETTVGDASPARVTPRGQLD
jgi:diguanylate cyclase (GGDEF)-like protein